MLQVLRLDAFHLEILFSGLQVLDYLLGLINLVGLVLLAVFNFLLGLLVSLLTISQFLFE